MFARRPILVLTLLALILGARESSAQSGAPAEVVLYASSASRVGGQWSVVPDAAAAGGARLQSADLGSAKVTTALSAPASYVELTFEAAAGGPYRLWIRGKAKNDYWGNDSVHVQFSGSVSATGAPVYQIGTSGSAVVNLEDAANAGLAGWGWQDNGYGAGVPGPAIYFAATGTHTLRIQVREDGLGIDQIVLSPATYLNASPGTLKNDATILPATGGGGSEPPPAGDANEIVLYASSATRVGSQWTIVSDASAAGGSRLQSVDARVAKVTTALAAPASYAELTFEAASGQPYRLWLRGRAQNDYWGNDSVHVQFSGAVTASGAPLYLIGTTDAAVVNLEDGSGVGLSGWGWQDNGYGVAVLGPVVYFEANGPQTLRIQVREDGLGIDQVVLSAVRYLDAAPGSLKNDATILPASGSPGPPAAISIVHPPYLQQVGATDAIVVWATREPGTARVRYQDESGSTATIGAASTLYPASRTGMGDYYRHVSRLRGLMPSSTYTYDVELNGADPLPETHRFTTAPPPHGGQVTFIAFGDSGTGSAEQQRLAALMSADTFDLALHAGDLAYGSSDGLGAATHATTTDWFVTMYRGWLASAAVFPSLGNHDSRAANLHGRPYLDVFELPGDAAAGAYADHAERYYSFDYGPVHFVALDTELAFQDPSRRAEQLAWLEADLAASPAPWKVAFFHRSPFSAGGEHGSDLAVRSAFSPIFEQYGVQLVISAHEHTYERTKPWRIGTIGSPVTYVVTGGGGGPLYASGTAAWTAVSGSFHHYLKGNATTCTLTLDAIAIDGSTRDSVTLNRCGG